MHIIVVFEEVKDVPKVCPMFFLLFWDLNAGLLKSYNCFHIRFPYSWKALFGRTSELAVPCYSFCWWLNLFRTIRHQGGLCFISLFSKCHIECEKINLCFLESSVSVFDVVGKLS